MINKIISLALIIILVIGCIFKPILGLLFITNVVLLFACLFNICNYIIKADKIHTKLLILDVSLKMLYYILGAIIFNCEYMEMEMLIAIAGFLMLLIVDVCFVHIRYNYQKIDVVDDSYIKTSKIINIMHFNYKLGDRDALFGMDNICLY